MHLSKEWSIPPWVQAALPATAADRHWRVWQGAYLWAQTERGRYLRGRVS